MGYPCGAACAATVGGAGGRSGLASTDRRATGAAMPDAENGLGPMPPHNLLVHVVGYVDHGCAACDWLRAAGVLPPAEDQS